MMLKVFLVFYHFFILFIVGCISVLNSQFHINRKQMAQKYSLAQVNYQATDGFECSANSFVRQQPQRRVTIQGCQKANYELALANVKKLSNRFDDNMEISCNVDVQYFKRYGPGIYLFFKFVKYLAVLFSMMAAIHMAPVVFNTLKGSGFSSIISSTSTYFGMTTIGNLNSTPQSTTSLDSSTSYSYKLGNAVPDLIASALFVGFYLFWQFKSDKLTEEVKNEVNFQSFYTLQINDFPVDTTEQELKQFFSQFGQIKQVSSVKNYSELISYCKQIYQLELAKKQMIFQCEKEENITLKEELNVKVRESDIKIKELEMKVCFQNEVQRQNILKFYVVFSSPKIRQKALKQINKHRGCCKWGNKGVPQNLLLKGYKLGAEACHNEPGDIIWQNQHITWRSRFWRSTLQALLLLILISVTFLSISFLNIATPTTSTTIDTHLYDASSILSVTNSTILYVWCIKNSDLTTTVNSIDSLCSSYLMKYYISIAVGVLISLVVVGVKTVLKKVVIFLAKFQRYKQHTEQSMSIMKNLFITYICTTVLITLLLQAQIFGISFKKFIGNFIKSSYLLQNVSSLTEYSDFNPFWYIDIGYKITLTWFILALQVPIVNPIISLILEKVNLYFAKKQLTQKGMENKMLAEQFQIEDHYANLLLILFVGLAFSAGMPMIMVPCAIAFVLRYFYFKLSFIRFSRVPKSLDQALNQKILNILPFAILLHFLFGIWMLGSESVFTRQSSIVNSLLESESSFWRNLGFLIVRFGNSWYYSVSFFVCLGIIILKMVVYDLIYENIVEMRDEERIPTSVFNKKTSQETNMIKITPKNKDKMDEAIASEMTSQKALTSSYRIQNNPGYFEVLAIMNRLALQNGQQ